MDISSGEVILTRLLAAAVLSGIIGWEREVHGRAAGLRTTILVGMGSCLFMMTAMHLFDVYQARAILDPGRMAAQVVSGIGFLGAGTIIRHGASVRGLTTAAGLWAVAGIGLAVGCGYDGAAVAATLIMVVVLVSLSRLERRLRKNSERSFMLEIDGGLEVLSACTQVLERHHARASQMRVSALSRPGVFRCDMKMVLPSTVAWEKIIPELSSVTGVTAVQCE